MIYETGPARQCSQDKGINIPRQDQKVVELRAGKTCLTVTSSHRIVVWRAQREQTVLAGTLRQGDHVMCSQGDRKKLEQVLQCCGCRSPVLSG